MKSILIIVQTNTNKGVDNMVWTGIKKDNGYYRVFSNIAKFKALSYPDDEWFTNAKLEFFS